MEMCFFVKINNVTIIQALGQNLSVMSSPSFSMSSPDDFSQPL